ncbi:uncharacterized protein LOC135835614 [Planococcus citri]|uniref:uncharacterized protein LOC135835614 n=1 Tax=Planococcus citri TaxID=170843 RepID=UPI0031F79CE5
MNRMINLLVTFICCIFICGVESANRCCPDSILVNGTECKDGLNINLDCDDYLLILDPSRSTYQEFSVNVDRERAGKEYLDSYVAGFHVDDPYFCIGDIQYSFDNRTHASYNVAVICPSFRKWQSDNYESASVQAKYFIIFYLLALLFNTISAVLLLTTAAIYYALPNLQNVQDSCYFYLTLFAGLAHLSFSYTEIFSTRGLLPDMCITKLYLVVYLVLCAMSWSNITSYHVWRSAMNYQSDNEAKLVKRYKICGFGVPLCIIILAWIHVHLKNKTKTIFVQECGQHERLVYEIYVSIPLVVFIILNFLMHVHSQIRVWYSHSIQLQDRKLAMKILKYRLLMNGKLFFMMGGPWALLVMVTLYNLFIGTSVAVVLIEFFAALLVLAEGIPAFLILVVFRKRVLKGMGNSWFANTRIYPDKWKTARDSETEEEVTDEETPSRNPSRAKYTAKIYNNSDNDNILDESAVDIL